MGQIGLLLHVSHLYDEKTLTLKLWIWGVLSHSTNAENPMWNGREHLTLLLMISQCLERGRNIGWSKKSNEPHFLSALTSREDNPLRSGYDILGQINFDAPSVPLHKRVSACFHEFSQRVTRYWRGFDSFKKHARAW